MGRFINADAFTSTGQGILGNNMFAYCGNNPVSRIDSSGYLWIPIWEYWIIHRMVQERIVNDYGYAMEVYVSKEDGHIGRLDLYDAEKNVFYEVKHINAASSVDTTNQINGYKTSTITDWRFLAYSIDGSPQTGSNTAIKGTFNYKTYTVKYYYSSNGVIVYKIIQNKNAVAAVAAVALTGAAFIAASGLNAGGWGRKSEYAYMY